MKIDLWFSNKSNLSVSDLSNSLSMVSLVVLMAGALSQLPTFEWHISQVDATFPLMQGYSLTNNHLKYHEK